MGLLGVTVVLLALQVTCSLVVVAEPPCSLTSPLSLTKVVDLLRNYTNYTDQMKNNASKSSADPTVLQLIEFALGTTGNKNLTKSRLNWQDSCFDNLKFTLTQVALMNGKDPDTFPGNATMNDTRNLLFSDAANVVVQEVVEVLEALKNRNVKINTKLNYFIQDVGFIINEASLLSIMCNSLNAGDQKNASILLKFNEEFLNVTLVKMAEYLFTTTEELQMLTVGYFVRYLLSAKVHLRKLQEFLKEERVSLSGKTLTDLERQNPETVSILTVLKRRYQGNNLTYIQFFGSMKVNLNIFDNTIVTFAKSTSMETAVLKNYTIEQLFEFNLKYAEMVLQYPRTVEADQKRRKEILHRYQVANVSILSHHFNVTSERIEQLTHRELENHAIKFYLHRYATVQLNMTKEELEELAGLEAGSLKNATVKNFVNLTIAIGEFIAIKTLNESKVLNYLVDDIATLKLHLVGLRKQIAEDRKPLTLDDFELFNEFELSFILYQYSFSAAVVYRYTVFNFTSRVQLNLDAFLYRFVSSSDRLFVRQFFVRYTFEEISRFFGVKKFAIFRMKFSDVIRKIISLEKIKRNECSPVSPCPTGVQCVDHFVGYTCRCPAGNLDQNNHCKDVNECKQCEHRNSCPENSHCVNTFGSFDCKCNKGYRKKADGTCEDIDECNSIFDNICFPNAICRNLPGSYECTCPAGMVFRERFRICYDINECQLPKPCGGVKHSRCIDKRGGYSCVCHTGYNATYNVTGDKTSLLNCTDINECSGSNNCHKDANCTNSMGSYTCRCKEGYIGDGFSCKENRFIRFTFSLIRFTGTVRLRLFNRFYYDGKKHSDIYISFNGLISIGQRYTRSSARTCKGLNKNILAPFWTNSEGGSVGYRQFVKEEEDSAGPISQINEIVRRNTNLKGFSATWGLVVSWEKLVPKYATIRCFFFFFCFRVRNPYLDEKNSFQAVLATNGTTSVVMYLYEANGMNWFRRLGRRALVGYATKSGACNEYEGSFTESIFNIDDQSFKNPAGETHKGMIVIVIGKPNEPETPEDKCLEWIRSQPKDNNWIDGLPSCPCTRQSALWDNRFRYFSQDSRRVCYLYMRDERREKTKTCCYFKSFGEALITNTRQAGRAARYSPRLERSLYSEHDEKPFRLCCIDSSKFCNDFSQYRPVEDECSNQSPSPCSCQWGFGWRRRRRRVIRVWWRRSPRRGFFFGDPHITTLDGYKFSFNGLGDYILLITVDKSHILHGKTTRPPHKNGGLSNATVFSGFAMRSKENTTVQVLFSETMPGNMSISVYNSTSKNCQPFGINAVPKQFPGFNLKNNSKTLIVMYLDSGFSVEITPGLGLLQIAFNVPPELADKNTTGLLGKLNGDPNDDLNYPNGTLLPTSSSDKEKFRYGQNWKVPDGESMFVHDNCTTKQVFFDGSFVPLFLSDLNITQEIIDVCGDNKQCQLDYFVTGNADFAKATLIFEKENDAKRAALDNQPPDITINPMIVNVTVNQTVTITVTAEDPNNDTVTLSDTGELPRGAVFNNATGIFTWTPMSGQQNENFKIEFTAVDSKNASQVKSVQAVKFCDCKNGQECDFTNVLRSDSNNSLEVVGCSCSNMYSGDYCETKLDPCEDEPCFDNVSCMAKNGSFGFVCGDCPKGLDGDGENCNDLDECLNATLNNCTVNQKCINTAGSFKCECKSGYESKTGGNNCTDIDECMPVIGENDCKANSACTNTPGSYNCSCKDGFEGDPKIGCTDIDECSDLNRCNHKCQNTEGSFKCTCNSGYRLKETMPNFFTCVDVDECEYSINNDCEQICANIASSYRCKCREGFVLNANNKTCSVNNTCSQGHGCGWKCGVVSGQDTCYCPRGQNLTSNGKDCQDINECLANTDGCAQNCTNNMGNYTCSCGPGFTLAENERDCKDIDECKVNNGGCSQMCANTIGNRTCSCKTGFSLEADKKTCKDIDECKDRTATCTAEGQKCKNEIGGYVCKCPRGKISDGTKCQKARRFRLRMRIRTYKRRQMNWRIEYEDRFSVYHRNFVNLIIFNVNRFFRLRYNVLVYFGCSVLGLSRGSVIANVSLNFNPNSNVSVAAVTNEINNSRGVMGDLGIDPAAIAVSDINECGDQDMNDCHQHATCKNELGTFSCSCNEGYEGNGVTCDKKPTKVDGSKTAMIVGICIAAAVVIIIIIVLIICCYKREKKGDLHVTENESYSVKPVHLQEQPKNGEVYYDNTGRRGSDESMEGQYDVASATMYDNPPVYTKKDDETPM